MVGSQVTAHDLAALIRQESPEFTEDQAGLSFEELGIDSFGMLELRVRIEQAARPIPDKDWVTLTTPAALFDYLALGPTDRATKTPGAIERHSSLNMPQMALQGLSESWLFKEIGDAHWAMLTSGLRSPSSELRDGSGERLYATFTRIRVEATSALARFAENERLDLEGRIERFGAGMFFSEIDIAGEGKSIRASTMSSFTKRGSPTSNSSLLRGQPAIPQDCPIEDVGEMPEFGRGYRERRGAAVAPGAFECEYELAPYYDINGVGLLYFAAYPIISDLCELRFVGRGNDWALETSTVRRDVYYFANCDANDRVIYRAHSREDGPDTVVMESSLSRASDGALLAYLVTTKARLDA